MKKYIKDNGKLLDATEIRWLVYDDIDDVPDTFTNQVLVIVKDDGIYKCNGSTKTCVYKSKTYRPNHIGEVKMFYGTTIPSGWLECNGQSFDTSVYPDLYTYLGAANVPDYREMCRCSASDAGQNWWYSRIGTHTHTLLNGSHNHNQDNSEISAHNHTFNSKKLISTYGWNNGSDFYPFSGRQLQETHDFTNVTTPVMDYIEFDNSNQRVGDAVGTTYNPVGSITRDRQIGVIYIICAKAYR